MKILQSPNILNWYPFEENQKVLEIADETEKLTEMLRKKCNIVKSIKQLSELDYIEEKFDIVTLIGINEYQKIDLEKLVIKLEKILNPNGKILMAVDNKFGLRFWAGNPEKILNQKFTSLIGYNNEALKTETYTKKYIENILKGIGYNTRFYYPLPDYKLPNVIFTDEQLPEYNSIDKYNPYFLEKSDILFNEIDVFREILKTNKDIFTFFANSFLVEITKGEGNKKYKYISFNNMRKKQYQLITKISDTYVEKQEVDEKATEHYENIKKNIKYLQENGIKTVDYVEGKKIKSKYIEQKYLLNNILTEKLEQGKITEFEEIINSYIKEITIEPYKETEYEKTVFGKYKIEIKDKSIIESMNFVKNGLWDMTFKNCFWIENQFYFFDQEWNELNLPVEYILYRSILYTISLRRFISIEELFEKYNLKKYLLIFEQLDSKIQEQIRDNVVWEFYSENHNFNIDDTKKEMDNMKLRSELQKQEIENLNTRFNSQQAENTILKEKNAFLEKELEKITNEKNDLQKRMNEKFFYKVKRKIKKIIR